MINIYKENVKIKRKMDGKICLYYGCINCGFKKLKLLGNGNRVFMKEFNMIIEHCYLIF